jgi:hypothetical protein
MQQQHESMNTERTRKRHLTAFIAAGSVALLGLILWIVGHMHRPVPEAPQEAVVTQPVTPAPSAIPQAPAPPDPCDDIFARQKELDSGSARDIPGPIQETSPTHSTPDYMRLKKCWRRERLPEAKPDFRYGGMFFRRSLHLGMTEEEVVNALPQLPDELIGTVSEFSANNPHLLDWLKEKCVGPRDPSDNAAITCIFSQPAMRPRSWLSHTRLSPML